MKAYVICCNNCIEFVVIGNKKVANEKLKELKEKVINKKFKNITSINLATYNYQNHWHIVTSDSLLVKSKNIKRKLKK